MAKDEISTVPPEEPENRAESLGRSLRSAREAAQVSVEQLAVELRIEPQFLVALEEERFEAIGAPVFAKGYLKLYCECLGLDYGRLLPLYEQRAGKQEPAFKGRHSAEHGERPQTALWAAGIAAAVVVVLLVVWALNVPAPTTVETPATALAPAAPAPAGTDVPDAAPRTLPGERDASVVRLSQREPSLATPPRGEPAAAEPASAESASAESASAGSASPQAEAAVAVRSPGADVGASADVESEARAASESAAGAASEAGVVSAAEHLVSAAGEGPSLEVDLQFLEDSWVEVTDARNERLYYGLAKAGSVSHIAGEPPFDVLLGNADGVVVEVAGEPYDYPRRSRNGKVARFTLTDRTE
jgi:cytoskeleton protein RodZ